MNEVVVSAPKLESFNDRMNSWMDKLGYGMHPYENQNQPKPIQSDEGKDLLNGIGIANFSVGATGTLAGTMGAGWKVSSNASKWSSAYKIAKSLEDTGIKVGASAIKEGITNGFKATGKLLGVASGLISVGEVMVNSQVKASNLLDVAVTGASMIPVVGWAIGGSYFIADMTTRAITNKSIGDHLNDAVGGPLFDWEW